MSENEIHETESTNTVKVGDQEVILGRPPAITYVHLLRLVRKLYKHGLDGLREELGASEEDDMAEVLGQIGEIDLFLAIVGFLHVEDLNTLGAILLQFQDLDEGVEFVTNQGGFDICWGMEAFAINCERADINRVMSSFRRAREAIQNIQIKS